jgi:hypothetical protein
MEDPKRFYTYAYLREDRTPYYIGKGSGKRAYKRKRGEIHPPKDKSKIILLKQNLTEEEAFKHEIYMISVFGRKDLGTGILRNRTNGGEGASGLIVSEETREKHRTISKIVAEKMRQTETGIFGITLGDRSEFGKLGGQKTYELGVGVHGRTKEQRIEDARNAGLVGGKRVRELGVGICGIPTEERSKRGKIIGRRNYENKTACFSITPEQRIEINKKTNSQRWMCLETGYITTAGPLTRYQKARGIDTSKRIRIS